ncbi:Hypothetical protein SMAX5B_003007 [Scophthalmus maximus]|uniref:Uncharacterized protein n=1 Tax=Scophthalmus maximus TaxID=52904 RepID=A0A2U9CJ74_SCOMX|nr:Hypothetical protein SMAX5B_003007 [Scophthalmus maximus]
MKLQTTALVMVLLATTSAKPARWHRLSDADIADTDLKHGWLDGNDNNWLWGLMESHNHRDSSSESSESSESSDSSESQSSEESSEEVPVTNQTPPPVATTAAAVTTTAGAMTTDADAMMTSTAEAMTSTGDGRQQTPEPGAITTDRTTGTEATPVATSPGDVTHCVTEDIPTASAVTDNRGDN